MELLIFDVLMSSYIKVLWCLAYHEMFLSCWCWIWSTSLGTMFKHPFYYGFSCTDYCFTLYDSLQSGPATMSLGIPNGSVMQIYIHILHIRELATTCFTLIVLVVNLLSHRTTKFPILFLFNVFLYICVIL